MMDTILGYAFSVNEVLLALITLLGAIIVIAQKIPGDQPEKFLGSMVRGLDKAVAFIAKYSKK